MASDNLPALPERTPLYTTARVLFGFLFRTLYPVTWHYAERAQRMQPPYIIIGNHKSFADPIALALPIRQHEIRFVGKRELANKWTEKLMRGLHMIPVSRGATDMGAMRACMKVLKDGHILGIFPEGTRRLPKLMQEIESGAALIALRTGAPVLPVYIDGHIRPFHRTHVYFGELLETADLIAQGVNSDTVAQLCTRIRETYYAMRAAAAREK